MSVREGLVGLTSQEIAGLIGSTIELDTILRADTGMGANIFAMGGMGGDKGLINNGTKSKFFSISTTGGLSLANFGLVHKHDSYPNTSKVAGQTAREAMGARSDLRTADRFIAVLLESGFLGSSCHTTRTLHAISHRLRGETINHVIGPGAIPHSAGDILNPLIGVNQNVHPVTYMQALLELHKRGVQQYGSGMAFAGLNIPSDQITRELASDLTNPDTYYRRPDLKNQVILDEFAPPPFASLVAFMVGGQIIPTIVTTEDFMTSQDARSISLDKLAVPNTSVDILAANEAVITGTDSAKVRYIAMTVAMGRFTKDLEHNTNYLSPDGIVNREVLRGYYYDTLALLLTGRTDSVRMQYVTSSNIIR